MSIGGRVLTKMALGALIGAGAAMADRETRQYMIQKGKKAVSYTTWAIKNPREVSEELKIVYEDTRDLFNKLADDVSYLNNKWDELKEATPPVLEAIHDTKEVIEKWRGEEPKR
ncbi:hypothetical protein ACU3L3_24015 [Priestia endophytica]|jgi:hypothetical protein|uniref:YtxH domain-containing protein n=1 Tax=Priestia endophytica DSM 13796 TaxID=1121089 RepID=A0A1I6BMZ1_9BACI|nr:hypothetical protein [Priestia endophytica]KYG35457.1 hypothetical protein AZF06_19065 [Priestia endophytica]MBG9810346.1 hypothetical protein [Priestia endophytica]RAS78544.1 hypothetical protein A4R27_16760 [Priestia endophytica]SFQ82285.1 hypothetical protein SAMN02745910_03878 [Priestia endophytica DSM 13796]